MSTRTVMARSTLAKSASTLSLRLRSMVRAKPWHAVDVFDLAQATGVEVRFVKIASMEGMYLRQDPPAILLASERPTGRQRFTCAHELGHHVFGDGTRVDELLNSTESLRPRSEEEVRADMFAGLLLMPKTAVEHAFSVRNIPIASATAIDVFRVSCWLGVGYSTLLNHLKYALHIIPEARFSELIQYSPRLIREDIMGQQTSEDLVLVDQQWDSRPVDVREGDLLLMPKRVRMEGRLCRIEGELRGQPLFRAVVPGIARCETPSGWAAFLRVSRRDYEGRSIFRHLEEVEGD